MTQTPDVALRRGILWIALFQKPSTLGWLCGEADRSGSKKFVQTPLDSLLALQAPGV